MPRFSVIIPTFDRPRQLAACLDGLTKLEGRPDFEVIVVDDGSPTPAEESVARFHDALDVRVIRQARRGPAVARNRGVAAARGTHLAFTDDDCVPDPGWLSEFDRVLREEPECLLGGALLNGLPDNPFSTATHLIVSAVYAYYDRHPGLVRFFNTSNLVVPKVHLEALGGFSETFRFPGGEDYDLCDRWRSAGLPVHYAPAARVSHRHPLGFTAFLGQHFTYGRGLLHFRDRARRRSGRSSMPSRPGFYRNLFQYPVSQPSELPAWAAVALIACAQLSTAAGAAYERWLGPAPSTEGEAPGSNG